MTIDLTANGDPLGSGSAEHALIDLTSDPALVFAHPSGNLLHANEAARAQYDLADIESGLTIRAICVREGTPCVHPDGSSPRAMRCRHKAKDGRLFDVETRALLLRFAGRPAVALVARPLDGHPNFAILEQKERQLAELAASLQESEKRYRTLFERNPAGVYRSNIDGVLLECNPSFAEILGYASPQEVMSRSILDLYFSPEERADAVARVAALKTLQNFEVMLRKKDGTAVWVLLNERLVENNGHGPIMEGTLIDITDRKRAEDFASHQANHDALTLLPNRWLFKDRLATAINRARRHRVTAAVMLVGLDHFKLINDSLGHSGGDNLLRDIAARLDQGLREEDTVARLAGDEFLLLFPEIGEKDIPALAEKVLTLVSEPSVVYDDEVCVTASIGIAFFPHDANDPDTLIRNAQSALYRAKEAGRACYRFYTPSAQRRAQERLKIESALRHAIERTELLLYYQPQVDLVTGEVVGAEALLRWNRDNQIIPPGDFIHVAEESGLIMPIGEWSLRAACENAAQWHSGYARTLRMAINLSPRQFVDPLLVDRVERVIRETGVDPQLVELEITESVAMQDLALAQRVLHQFHDLGIRISMDDFGTGYSSLNYLRLLPIQTLKIDRYFVADLHRSRDRAIVRSIIDMAHTLDLRVLAEGVETEEQLAVLKELGCDEMQGFLFSRPIPAADFEASYLTAGRDPA